MNPGIPNHLLTAQARAALSGRWTTAVCANLIYVVIGIVAAIIGAFFGRFLQPVAQLLLAPPVYPGLRAVMLAIIRGEPAQALDVLSGFKVFRKAMQAYMMVGLFVMLWSLLIIIPGIIAARSYSMTFFIISDNPEISPWKAIMQSNRMMEGYRTKFFFLYLRFIGWGILCLFTFGIGTLWLAPYMIASFAAFYEDLKKIHPADTVSDDHD